MESHYSDRMKSVSDELQKGKKPGRLPGSAAKSVATPLRLRHVYKYDNE
jgi:hypothetical protein